MVAYQEGSAVVKMVQALDSAGAVWSTPVIVYASTGDVGTQIDIGQAWGSSPWVRAACHCHFWQHHPRFQFKSHGVCRREMLATSVYQLPPLKLVSHGMCWCRQGVEGLCVHFGVPLH